MLNVTNAAREFLAEKLLELQASEGEVIRVFASGEGLSLEVGQVQADDRAIRHKDKPVLAVAASVSEAAHDRTLDIVATVRGPKLKVTERAVSEPDLRGT